MLYSVYREVDNKASCPQANIQKAGDPMLNNEKELNCYLLDQLELIERLELVAQYGDNEAVLKQLMLEKKFVERKLYQKPPLTDTP